MKKKIMEFAKEFILMAISFSVVGFIIFKLFDKNFSIANLAGFMIGWSIVKIIEMMIENKKSKK